ncbi:hypothetical protein [Leisingera aquaemixtae]|uniref:hypothetical protein n=1 Tax=Leisingera aquaemixtae TaxID=1396826 RepID=UPI0021A70066|nr:hypothetical protein [Leisingera aquaemixtae]UWQ46861.1 hypothetical protein K3719_05720 [Leisingera aquaemixtae]
MELIENSEKTEAEARLCAIYARALPGLASDINDLLAKHGIDGVEIQSFSFAKAPGLISNRDKKLVLGVGSTADGVCIARMYEK